MTTYYSLGLIAGFAPYRTIRVIYSDFKNFSFGAIRFGDCGEV